MNDRKNNPIEPWETGCYETGSTRPPKSHGGIIAVLLVAVILLCGISTALGVLNIRLHLQLKNTENASISFSKTDRLSGDIPGTPALGFSGQALSVLEQRFYRLPAGIYITEIFPGGAAERAGLQEGDVLISVNRQNISTEDSLNTVLDTLAAGDTVQVIIYRNYKQYAATLTLDQGN